MGGLWYFTNIRYLDWYFPNIRYLDWYFPNIRYLGWYFPNIRYLDWYFTNIRYLDYGPKHHWLFEHNKRLWKYCMAGGWKKSVHWTVKFIKQYIGNLNVYFIARLLKRPLTLTLISVLSYMFYHICSTSHDDLYFNQCEIITLLGQGLPQQVICFKSRILFLKHYSLKYLSHSEKKTSLSVRIA